MTLTTWLLVFGSLTVAAIVIDGMRRMFASHAALSINIDETLCGLPQEEYPSELPNGGARLIDVELEANGQLEPAILDLPELDLEELDIEELDIEELCIEEAFDELTSEVQFEETSSEETSAEETSAEVTLASVEELVEELDEELDDEFTQELDESPVTQEPAPDRAGTIALDSHKMTNITQAPDPLSIEDTFSLDASPKGIMMEEISASSMEAEQVSMATDTVSDSLTTESAPALDFDPTRPVHEWVETNSMVQSDLFAAQDLTALATEASAVAHSLVETSDDILFSDTGIEELTQGGEALTSQNQDQSLSTRLAKVTSMTFGRKLLNRRRVAEQVAADLALVEERTSSVAVVEQVISILVTANNRQGFYGPALLQLIEGCGLVHGDMNIFHRFEDGLRLGKTQFSMANMMEPGTFDLTQMDQLHTPGVVFFLGLPTAQNSMQAFDYMLETAQCLASNLGGDVLDEQRSVMRPQTIEHCRQQIREFERRHMTRRAQL